MMVELLEILHGLGDGRIGLGRDAEIDVAQIDAVIVQLPRDHAIGDLSPAVADADRSLGRSGCSKDTAY